MLVAGTTGCGKSTTLAGMIDHINTNQKRHIITMEDPVEYVFEDNQCIIEQREVGLDTPSYQHGLKHVMRQDPDVIMVGEIRDFETAEIAIKAALTGHLVLSTLHTNDAPSTVSRLLNMGVEPFLITASLNAVVAQRQRPEVPQGAHRRRHFLQPVLGESERTEVRQRRREWPLQSGSQTVGVQQQRVDLVV